MQFSVIVILNIFLGGYSYDLLWLEVLNIPAVLALFCMVARLQVLQCPYMYNKHFHSKVLMDVGMEVLKTIRGSSSMQAKAGDDSMQQ